jgi:putative peptidoglycan lipid II flippase
MFGSARTLLFGGVTGKVLGVLREVLSAALLGTGAVASAFRLSQAAFFIPIQGFLSDSLSSGFTPQYAQERAAHVARARLLFSGMHAVALVVSVAIGALLVVAAPLWVRLLAPGFDAPTAAVATHMVQCLAIAMPFYALTSLYAAAELTAGRAAMAAARATVQSLGIMLGVALAWWWHAPLLIAVGFVTAYLVLTVWGVLSTRAEGLPLWPRAGQWAPVRSSLGAVWAAYRYLISVPALMQLHFIIERRVASVVNPHAVAAVDYARFVSETAVLLLAMPFGLAGLATMASVSEEQFRAGALKSLRLLLYLGVPLSVALLLHAHWVVKIAYGRGAFGAESVAVTAAILQAQGIGLWAQLLGYASARYLSARRRNRSMVAIYLLAVLINILLNLTVTPWLGAAGLGLASAVNSLIVGIAILWRLGLLRALYRDFVLLMVAAAGYGALWMLLPFPLRAQLWLPPVAFAAYWGISMGLVPRNRRVMAESWQLLRAA